MRATSKGALNVTPQEFQARTTIAALWASAMMCYIYADIIAFLVPGHLQGVLEGRLGVWTTTTPLLMGSAVVNSVPGVMIRPENDGGIPPSFPAPGIRASPSS